MNKYKEILKKYWGYSSFRPLQEEIIKSVTEDKKDALGLLPTGGGKSIIFQIPALIQAGFCLVVTPLIALMKDQVENLKKRGIKAAAIYSGMSSYEIDITLNNAVFGAYKFLYLSPERLSTRIFLARLPDMKINLVAVDEAHCISQWGYDFRPAYLNISEIRKYISEVPILALTATATPDVANDITEKLLFKEKNIFRKSFERKNLVYIVRKVENKQKYLLKIVKKQGGTGMIYVRNRKKTYETAKFLRKNGISADYFHAGIDAKLKDYKQNQWKNNQTRIIVSTNAFGMGIDKSDVRFVIHLDLPDSPEAYFQEAGRAGRDEKIAYAVLLFNKSDKINIKKRIKTNFPERKFIKRVYNSLCNYYQIPVGEGKGEIKAFKIKDFVTKFKLPMFSVFSSLKFLQNEGYIDFAEESFTPSKIHFLINRDDLYKFQVANAKFDNFIKLILRTYSGIFSDYVGFSEDFLAKKAGTNVNVIYTYLKKLEFEKIIKYIPQRKTPFIVFTEERLDNKNLRLSKNKYNERKKRYISRISAILHYAESKERCRNRILLSYFGEQNSERCGLCDICRKRKKSGMSDNEFSQIQTRINQRLEISPEKIESLIDNINFDENKIIKVIRFLFENKKIKYNSENKLFLLK